MSIWKSINKYGSEGNSNILNFDTVSLVACPFLLFCKVEEDSMVNMKFRKHCSDFTIPTVNKKDYLLFCNCPGNLSHDKTEQTICNSLLELCNKSCTQFFCIFQKETCNNKTVLNIWKRRDIVTLMSH